MIKKALAWYCASSLSTSTTPDEVSPTRDIFQARLDRFYRDVTNRYRFGTEDASLLTAVVGEIGNNCFDHNLGQWKDQPGSWFVWEEGKGLVRVCISDRGQGVLSSLKRVKADLKNEEEALKVAFEKILSGRSPEQRGNGLKFVRSIINEHPKRGLSFSSGCATIRLGERAPKTHGSLESKEGSGTLAIIEWAK